MKRVLLALAVSVLMAAAPAHSASDVVIVGPPADTPVERPEWWPKDVPVPQNPPESYWRWGDVAPPYGPWAEEGEGEDSATEEQDGE